MTCQVKVPKCAALNAANPTYPFPLLLDTTGLRHILIGLIPVRTCYRGVERMAERAGASRSGEKRTHKTTPRSSTMTTFHTNILNKCMQTGLG